MDALTKYNDEVKDKYRARIAELEAENANYRERTMTMYATKVAGEIQAVWPKKKGAEVMAERVFGGWSEKYEIVPVEVREVKGGEE